MIFCYLMLLSVTAICSFTFSCYRFKKCTQTNLKAIINHSLYTDQHKMKIFSSQPLDSNNISANRISGKELINHKWNLYKSMVKSKIKQEQGAQIMVNKERCLVSAIRKKTKPQWVAVSVLIFGFSFHGF